jgi:hypothetical protein
VPSDPGWTASPICSGLICGRHNLTGARFRQRVDAVVEKFNDMREDLDKERRFMVRQWARRETQIVAVVESTVGMVGDLQAIAGKAMPEISSLDAPLLEGPGEAAA